MKWLRQSDSTQVETSVLTKASIVGDPKDTYEVEIFDANDDSYLTKKYHVTNREEC